METITKISNEAVKVQYTKTVEDVNGNGIDIFDEEKERNFILSGIDRQITKAQEELELLQKVKLKFEGE